MAHLRMKPGPFGVALVGLLALAGMFAPSSRAADLGKADTSLKWIPADAGFYSTSLRTKEQLDACLRSKAWAEVKGLPFVQKLITQFNEEYDKKDGSLSWLREFYADKDNKQLMHLLADSFSSEIFCYGSESWGDFVALINEVNNVTRYSQILKLAGKGKNLDDSELQLLSILKILDRDRDKLKLPDITIGFKLTDTKPAENQLQRLEDALRGVIAIVPQLKALRGKVKRTKIGANEFLTIQLDGELVPWEEIDFKKLEDKPGEFDPLVKKLKALTLTFSLGVREGYLLVAFGPSTDSVAKLDGKGEKLSDRKEMKVLEKFAAQKVTSIGYASKTLADRAGGVAAQLDGMRQMLDALLPEAGLTEKDLKKIRNQLEEFSRDALKAMPVPGAVVSVSYMTDRGYESYSYDHATRTGLDGTKPLTILEHLGGSPILGFAARGRSDPDGYKTMVKHLKALWGSAEAILNAKLEGEAKDKFQKATKLFLPILTKMDEVNVKMLLPSMMDSQTAFVMDAKWTSARWHNALSTPKALPMIEFGLVVGVSDPDLFRKALSEYRTLTNEFLAGLREINPDMPELKIPEPKTKKGKAGDLYFYPIPEEVGLDAQFLPTGGISGKFAALTLSNEHTERLLQSTPLSMKGGPLAKNAKANLASAALFDWVGFVNALSPWVDYVAPIVIQFSTGLSPADDKKEVDEILKQVHTIITVLKCYKGGTSVTTIEDGVTVTHSEEVIEDLK
jgi:hypothetical protein